MKRYCRHCLPIVGILLALMPGNPGAVATPLSQAALDARQESQIAATYAASPYLRFCKLKVSVSRGAARISGSAEDDINRDLALDIARGVNGINIVENSIVIRNRPDAKHSPHAGAAIDDATITLTIRSKLYWSRTTDGLPIAVETNQGRVILRGSVDTAATRSHAGGLAISTRGVVSVDNRLLANGRAAVVGAYKTEPQGGINAMLSDRWISSRVKAAFLYSVDIFDDNIEVSTQDGAVALSGKVRTPAERALAIGLAKDIRGVRSVDSEKLTF
ncbi:BON domain-containing protein [Chromobacterium sphagni]|uniref:BON domain-containing protein n=1 Tax=Chromobacterium sphagni TaxID=1903179 RepID=A0ABX3CAB1_9NEIS|nr:BON domain-containing protein [Chromobacterium sphagni]OHX19203.1 hypothetical protein BI344_18750 [Chromobacterium sphagni]